MIYASDDASRVSRTLRLLAEYDISQWALTGGTAIELYLRGVRPLHDLDFVAASFDCLPAGLGKAILIRHAHPHDPPAKTMLQAVDPATSVRVERAWSTTWSGESTPSFPLADAGHVFALLGYC